MQFFSLQGGKPQTVSAYGKKDGKTSLPRMVKQVFGLYGCAFSTLPWLETISAASVLETPSPPQ